MFDDLDMFYDERHLRRYLIEKHIEFDETPTQIASNPIVFKTKGGITIYPSVKYNSSSITFEVKLNDVEITGGYGGVGVMINKGSIIYEEISFDEQVTTHAIREVLDSPTSLNIVVRSAGRCETFHAEQPSFVTFVLSHVSFLQHVIGTGPSLVPDRQTALRMVRESLLAKIFL